MKTNTKLIFLFLPLALVDQTAKYFSSKLICNPNIAWNIPVAPAIFYFVWTAIIAALLIIFLKTTSFSQKIPLILIFSGAVSNLIDRIRLGCVIDFIDLKIWPVFNIADVYITIGILLLVIASVAKQSRVSSY